MSHTRLLLKNMEFYSYHGVYEAERELGQKIEVDVELESNFGAAGATDDLRLTINYSEVYALVRAVILEEKFNLIEAIGAAILKQIKMGYDLDRITVRVRKPQPPVGGLMETVEFEIVDKKN